MKIEIKNSPANGQNQSYPDIWTEIPPNGKICAHTGLKHAKLYSLLRKGGIGRPYVRIANLRDPGAKQAKTIFHLGDMLRFFDTLAAKQGSGQLRSRPEEAPAESGEQAV